MRDTHTHTNSYRHRDIFYSLLHSPNGCVVQGWGKLKAGVRSFFQVSHMGSPGAWDIFNFPRHIGESWIYPGLEVAPIWELVLQAVARLAMPQH